MGFMTVESNVEKPRKKYDHTAEKKAMAALADRLEAKYAEQSLRIVQCFDGISPVQANGYLGREVFYFRFRSDVASLEVGLPDWDKGRKEGEHGKMSPLRKIEATQAALIAGEISVHEAQKSYENLDLALPSREVDPLYPDIVSKVARIEGVTGNRYAGLLSHNRLETIFCKLMDNLIPQSPELMHNNTKDV